MIWRGAVWQILLTGLFCSSNSARAGEPVWPTGRYEYTVVDEDLRDVLLQFGTNTGLRIVLSDKVQGHVNGRLPSAAPRGFLDNLTKSFGLDWYYDGTTLWISAGSEASTKLLPLRGVALDSLERSLLAADLSDRRFPLRSGGAPNLALASGPPHYLSMVGQVLDQLAAAQTHPVAAAVKPAPKFVTIIRGAGINQTEFPSPGNNQAITVTATTVPEQPTVIEQQRSLRNVRNRPSGKRS